MSEWRTYKDRRPVALPSSWLALRGPHSGPVTLPDEVSWTGRREYDLDDVADAQVLYERVLVDAVIGPVVERMLNGERLRALWPHLFLPFKVWEARFAELARVDGEFGPSVGGQV